MTEPSAAESELQGWYYRDATSEAVRVRLSIEATAISLHTLSGRLIAGWGPEFLETRVIATMGKRWTVGDRRLPEAFLVVENDQDYQALRKVAVGLPPVQASFWKQLGLSAIESGNLTGWPVLVLLGIAVPAVIWLWNNLPLAYCIAKHQDTILFLKCLIIDHFIP